ncbi:MAG: oligosaccharide flippase family protein, partial [Alphaproteobacteria bacterium]|nr:oligosaccharide flippase family protein [Alphaproteobacteria bacterium]
MGKTQDLSSRAATGAAWMVALRMCNRVIGIISTIILARLLVPEDFGLISLAATFQGLIETMSEFALDLALIRTKDASRTLYDSAWTFSVLRGLAIALVVVALSNEVAAYYGQPGLRNVMSWLAITAFLQGFQNIGVVDFRKMMDFRKDFLFSVSGRILGTMVTIIVAIWLRSYWALVIGLIARVGA